ncbi:transposase [Streptomyces sp. NPDC056656]|uniref:IS110 family transposase n=1 Tax=Streptomyces sp. NPDC056656 TaxID=3345895 RepID=UPI003685140F
MVWPAIRLALMPRVSSADCCLRRCVLSPKRWACPDRGLRDRRLHSPDRHTVPASATVVPEAIRRQATMPGKTRQRHPRHDRTDQHDQVLPGVDTHKDVHVAAVITSTGLLLDTRSFPTTREGYRQLLSWARAFGRLQRAGVECTGSYGAALTRCLHQEGITVTEVNQPDKGARRPARQVRLHRCGSGDHGGRRRRRHRGRCSARVRR